MIGPDYSYDREDEEAADSSPLDEPPNFGANATAEPADTTDRRVDVDGSAETRIGWMDQPNRSTSESGYVPHIDGITIRGIQGGGGNSTVYAGWQAAFQRDVAVKVINVGITDIARFKRECEQAGRLGKFQGVVDVYESGFVDGRPFLIMPLLKGGSLADHIRKHGPLPERVAVELGAKLARTVHEVHTDGSVHRDIKPENILFASPDSLDTPYLIDFGLSINDQATSNASLNAMTPPYAAPERLEGRADLKSIPSDIYSLGALLFAAIEGHPPFGTDSDGGTGGLTLRILSGAISQMQRVGDDRLRNLVINCLARRPEDRPSSALVVAERLEAILQTTAPSTLGTPPIAPEEYGFVEVPTGMGRADTSVLDPESARIFPEPSRTPDSGPGRPRPRWLLPVAAVAASLAAIVGLLLFWLGNPGPKPPDGTTSTSSSVRQTAAAQEQPAPELVAANPLAAGVVRLTWRSETPATTVAVISVDGGPESFPIQLEFSTDSDPFVSDVSKLSINGVDERVDTAKHSYCARLKVVTEEGYVESGQMCTQTGT